MWGMYREKRILNRWLWSWMIWRLVIVMRVMIKRGGIAILTNINNRR